MKSNNPRLFTAPIFCACLLGNALLAVAQSADKQITTFDVSANTQTVPTSISGRGEIAGYYLDATGVAHGFTRDKDGTIATFDAPGAGTHGTFPVSINGRGEIAGYYYGSSVFVTHAFVRESDGKITAFDVGPNTQTFPASINSKGEITGYYNDAGFPHGFIRAADGTISTFFVLGPNSITFPASINSRGEITGSCNDAGGIHGFVRREDGGINTFDAGPNGTVPASINSKGEITGYYLAPGGQHGLLVHGFLRHSDGSIASFDADPPIVGTYAQALTREVKLPDSTMMRIS